MPSPQCEYAVSTLQQTFPGIPDFKPSAFRTSCCAAIFADSVCQILEVKANIYTDAGTISAIRAIAALFMLTERPATAKIDKTGMLDLKNTLTVDDRDFEA
jgi:hypothetical protein